MRVIFSLLLIISINYSYSQSYYPLIKSNKYWDIFDGDGTQICNLSSGGRYFFEGDTSILGNQYRVLKRYPIIATQSGPYCPPFAIDSSYSGIVAFLREDTIQKKVYQFDLMYNEDDLLYDFSLSGGDTLFTNYAGDGTVLIIDSVTDITILNNEQRKLFWLNNGQYYIESIGHNNLYGVLFEGIGFWREIHCVLDNDIHLYGTQCYNYVGIDKLISISHISIYPNPAKDILHITLSNNDSNINVKLYNSLGNVIYNDNFTDNTIINTSYFSSGIYFLKLTNAKTNIVEKIIIQ